MLCNGVDVTAPDAVDFDALYARIGPRLWRAILAFTGGGRDLTDDVVAEAFVRTFEAGDSVRSPDAYVYRVAFRLAARELRQRPATEEAKVAVAQEDDLALVELFDVLKQLSPGQRAAIYLRYETDLPVAEIAHLMGRRREPCGSIYCEDAASWPRCWGMRTMTESWKTKLHVLSDRARWQQAAIARRRRSASFG